MDGWMVTMMTVMTVGKAKRKRSAAQRAGAAAASFPPIILVIHLPPFTSTIVPSAPLPLPSIPSFVQMADGQAQPDSRIVWTEGGIREGTESGSDRWWGMVTSGSLPPSRPAPSLRFPVHPVGRKAEPKLDLWSPAGKDGESVSEEAGEERSGSKRSTSHYHPFLPQPPADQERDIIAAVSGR